jgi:hypothetical protein
MYHSKPHAGPHAKTTIAKARVDCRFIALSSGESLIWDFPFTPLKAYNKTLFVSSNQHIFKGCSVDFSFFRNFYIEEVLLNHKSALLLSSTKPIKPNSFFPQVFESLSKLYHNPA